MRPSDLNEDWLKSLLAELKYLYTAITRAKVNLWIYDSKGNAPFYFWLSTNLARLVKADDVSSTSNEKERFLFAAPSEKEQWAKQGDYYFRIGKWKLATTCYKQADLSAQFHIAQAYALVEEAAKEQSTISNLERYKRAALAFLKAEYIEKAILCLKRCRMHEMSAKLLEKKNEVSIVMIIWGEN